MRFLILTAFFVMALAGCLDTDADANPATGGNGVGGVNGGNMEGSHPAYGYLVHDSLPVGTGYFQRQVRETPATPSAITLASEVGGGNQAGGIAVLGNLAFFGQRTTGPMEIVDISNPAEPVIVGSAPDTPVRDANTIVYPSGQVVVITTAGGLNIFATDVTNPAKPVLIGEFTTPGSNHNIAVVPGTPIVYNSGKDIVDFSDPAAPALVGKFSDVSEGCHDTTFFISREMQKYRAYCAGYSNSEIWDILDPSNPVLIHKESFPDLTKGVPVAGNGLPDSADFPLSFSHLAMVNHDASVFIVGDETGGGAANACDVYADSPLGTISGPIGNLWFYDLSDETNPILAGYLSPTVLEGLGGSCTAHFGDLIGDTGFLVMGFYDAGVTLVDFTDIENPTFASSYKSGGIWDVWYRDGFLYTGDMVNGMEVLNLA